MPAPELAPEPFKIAFYNHADAVDGDRAFRAGVAAIDAQLRSHVNPVWGTLAEAGLLGETTRVDAVAHVLRRAHMKDALAYHTAIAAGRPMIVIGMDVCKHAGIPWTVAASHEAIETALDPNCERRVLGRLEELGEELVLVDREACDPVQGFTYSIDDVEVSNFVYPAWFNLAERAGARFDHLEKLTRPFQLGAGGYVSFVHPNSGKVGQVYDNDRARSVRRAKVAAGVNRSRQRQMNVPAFLGHVVELGKELGADLRRDPDGRVRLTLVELGRIAAAVGLVIVDAAGVPVNLLAPK